VLDLTVDGRAAAFFEPSPHRQKLETLNDVGSGYIHLGQRRPRSPAARRSA
jgi:excinuclease UvrABC ATPase subunit